MSKAVFAGFFLFLFAGGCLQPPIATGPYPSPCSKDLKICPDGSSVARVPPACEFAPCQEPETGTDTIPFPQEDQTNEGGQPAQVPL